MGYPQKFSVIRSNLPSQFQPFASCYSRDFSMLCKQHIKHLLQDLFVYLFVNVVDIKSLAWGDTLHGDVCSCLKGSVYNRLYFFVHYHAFKSKIIHSNMKEDEWGKREEENKREERGAAAATRARKTSHTQQTLHLSCRALVCSALGEKEVFSLHRTCASHFLFSTLNQHGSCGCFSERSHPNPWIITQTRPSNQRDSAFITRVFGVLVIRIDSHDAPSCDGVFSDGVSGQC